MALKYIIFDLDDTLYPRDSGLRQEIGRRIQMWLCERMGLTWEEAIAMRREYYHQYGITLGGLIAEHDFHDDDVHDYLLFVHGVPVDEYLDPNLALAEMLASIPLRRAVYTNAPSEYAGRVLRALGVTGCFEQVIGIEEVGLRNKLFQDAYEQALVLLGARGSECVMVEDSARNLQPAQALGMTTVLVGADGSTELAKVPDESADFMVESVLEVEKVVNGLLPE